MRDVVSMEMLLVVRLPALPSWWCVGKHLRFKDSRTVGLGSVDPGFLVASVHSRTGEGQAEHQFKIPPSDLRPPSKRNHRRESDIHMKNMTKL